MASTLFDSSSTSVFQQVEQYRRDFWRNHAHLTEAERQDLWFQATSIPPNNAFNTTHASMVQQTPRSLPTAQIMTQLPTTDYLYTDRLLSAPMMSRSISAAGSDSDAPQRSSSMSDWHSSLSEQANSYALFSDSSSRRNQQTLQSIAEVPTYLSDAIVECSPAEFVNQNNVEPLSSSSFPPSLSIHPQQLHDQLTPNQQWCQSSDGSTAPSTPSTALMTPVTHSSNPMSRQSSYDPNFLASASMLRIQSDSSCMYPILSEDEVISLDSSFNVDSKTIDNCVDTSSFPSFTGSASEAFFSSANSVSSSAQVLGPSGFDTSYLAEDMRRSTSATHSEGNASDVSTSSSNCSRQSRREREINAQAAARKIAPKAIDSNDETESAPSHDQMAMITSEDGSSKTVGVITKTPYVRPQHPKIKCPYCSERPEGFRGTHELDRHIARAHAPSRKGYICVDYSEDKKFLSSCKHCRNKKVYGAYYNAAAHLRRTHFHPRKRGRKGKNDEKRGGIGGGDDPPMEYLKQYWIKEVEVNDNKSPSSPESGSEDAAEPNNSFESNLNFDASYPAQLAMPSSMNTQVHIDPSQYDYGMSAMSASEPMIYENTFVGYNTNIVATNDISNFQFDASYMAP